MSVAVNSYCKLQKWIIVWAMNMALYQTRQVLAEHTHSCTSSYTRYNGLLLETELVQPRSPRHRHAHQCNADGATVELPLLAPSAVSRAARSAVIPSPRSRSSFRLSARWLLIHLPSRRPRPSGTVQSPACATLCTASRASCASHATSQGGMPAVGPSPESQANPRAVSCAHSTLTLGLASLESSCLLNRRYVSTQLASRRSSAQSRGTLQLPCPAVYNLYAAGRTSSASRSASRWS